MHGLSPRKWLGILLFSWVVLFLQGCDGGEIVCSDEWISCFDGSKLCKNAEGLLALTPAECPPPPPPDCGEGENRIVSPECPPPPPPDCGDEESQLVSPECPPPLDKVARATQKILHEAANMRKQHMNYGQNPDSKDPKHEIRISYNNEKVEFGTIDEKDWHDIRSEKDNTLIGFSHTTESDWTILLNDTGTKRVWVTQYAYPTDSHEFRRRTLIKGTYKGEEVLAEVMDCSKLIENIFYRALDAKEDWAGIPNDTQLYQFFRKFISEKNATNKLDSTKNQLFRTEILREYAAANQKNTDIVKFHSDNHEKFKTETVWRAFKDNLKPGDIVGIYRTENATLSKGHVLLYVGEQELTDDHGKKQTVKSFVHASNLNFGEDGYGFDKNDTESKGAVMYLPLEGSLEGEEGTVFKQNFRDAYYDSQGRAARNATSIVYNISLIEQLFK